MAAGKMKGDRGGRWGSHVEGGSTFSWTRPPGRLEKESRRVGGKRCSGHGSIAKLKARTRGAKGCGKGRRVGKQRHY